MVVPPEQTMSIHCRILAWHMVREGGSLLAIVLLDMLGNLDYQALSEGGLIQKNHLPEVYSLGVQRSCNRDNHSSISSNG